MERQFQEMPCRKSSNLAALRFHHIFANFQRAIVFTNKQCVLRFTLKVREIPTERSAWVPDEGNRNRICR